MNDTRACDRSEIVPRRTMPTAFLLVKMLRLTILLTKLTRDGKLREWRRHDTMVYLNTYARYTVIVFMLIFQLKSIRWIGRCCAYWMTT